MHEQTVVGELQAELSQVRAHEMIPHPGSLPAVPAMTDLETLRHREGLARMLAPAEEARPNDAIRLVRLVSTCWYRTGHPPRSRTGHPTDRMPQRSVAVGGRWRDADVTRIRWTAERDGIAHAHVSGRTLCHVPAIAERYAWPTRARCPACPACLAVTLPFPLLYVKGD